MRVMSSEDDDFDETMRASVEKAHVCRFLNGVSQRAQGMDRQRQGTDRQSEPGVRWPSSDTWQSYESIPETAPIGSSAVSEEREASSSVAASSESLGDQRCRSSCVRGSWLSRLFFHQPKKEPRRVINGGFALLGKVGSGSFASVEKCQRVFGDDRTIYAVKIMDRAKLAKKKSFNGQERRGVTTALDKIQEEIIIMRELRGCSHVVHLYEAYVDSRTDRLCLFMELVDGGPVMVFDDETRRFTCTLPGHGPCDPRVSMSYVHDVASGLAFMHARRIAHRDLKPMNLLRSKCSKGHCKISDFGVAHKFPLLKQSDNIDSLEALQRSRVYVLSGTEGTYAYFAPDMLRDTPFNPFACDIWALGVCLYNFLSARLPFDHSLPDDLFAAISTVEPPYASFDPEYQGLLKSLLDKDPSTRATLEAVLRCTLSSSRHQPDTRP